MGGTAEKRFFPSRYKTGRFFLAPKYAKEVASPMYRKVPTDMNFVEREKAVLDFWKEHDIVKKSFHRPGRQAAD